MNLLLDTHIWIWFEAGNPKLTKNNLELIKNAKQEKMLVSAASVWEIAMLVSCGRLELGCTPRIWVEESCDKLGLEVIPLTTDIVLESYALPDNFHGDPADRMIVATARKKGLTLITQDKAILSYSQKGYCKIPKTKPQPQ